MPTQDIKNFWHRHETSFQEIPVLTEKAKLFMMKWKYMTSADSLWAMPQSLGIIW